MPHFRICAYISDGASLLGHRRPPGEFFGGRELIRIGDMDGNRNPTTHVLRDLRESVNEDYAGGQISIGPYAAHNSRAHGMPGQDGCFREGFKRSSRTAADGFPSDSAHELKTF